MQKTGLDVHIRAAKVDFTIRALDENTATISTISSLCLPFCSLFFDILVMFLSASASKELLVAGI